MTVIIAVLVIKRSMIILYMVTILITFPAMAAKVGERDTCAHVIFC